MVQRSMKPTVFPPLACAHCILRDLCLPGSLTEPELERLEDLVRRRQAVPRGTALYRAGARCDARVHAGMAELVVGRALLAVRQDLVGFLGFLEVLLGLGIVRVAVGVPLHCELAISALDVLFRGVLVHSQHFVVIALCHFRYSLPFHAEQPG